MTNSRKRLGEMLVDATVISPHQLQLALQAQLIYGGRLGSNLVELDFLDERFLASFLASKLNLPSVQAEELENLPEETIRTISREHAQKYGVIPLARDRNVLTVAMIEPSDLAALDEIAFGTSCQIRPKVAAEMLVVAALERYYGVARKQRYLQFDAAPSVPPPPRPERKEISLPPLPPDPGSDLPELTGDLSVVEIPAAALTTIGPLADVAARLASAETPEGVLDAVVAAWDPHFDGKVIVFALTGPSAVEVVIATGPLEFRVRSRAQVVKLDRPHFLQQVYESRVAHAGIAAGTEENVALFAELDDEPSTPLLAMPLLIQGRVACIVLGLGPRSSLDESVLRLFGIILDKAAIAMEILSLRRRLLRLPEDLA